MSTLLENTARVGVDSGSIQFSIGKADLEKAGSLYVDVMEKSNWSAACAFDGKVGAIGTPWGDGGHTVTHFHVDTVDEATKLLDEHKSNDPDKVHRRIGSCQYLLQRPKDAPQPKRPYPKTTLYLGDCGSVHDQIELPSHRFLGFVWTDENNLLFVTAKG